MTGEGGGLPETPFNRICDLFGETPPHEALAVLIPFQDNPSQYIRSAAAMQIASIGAGAGGEEGKARQVLMEFF